jgi:hypothetical protein
MASSGEQEIMKRQDIRKSSSQREGRHYLLSKLSHIKIVNAIPTICKMGKRIINLNHLPTHKQFMSLPLGFVSHTMHYRAKQNMGQQVIEASGGKPLSHMCFAFLFQYLNTANNI